MRQLLQFVFLASLAFGQSQSPSLPTTWVDNNELTCHLTSNCYTGSPALTTPYTEPAYELELGANSWTKGPPPSYCTFNSGQPLYSATAAGKQAAINAIEACRTAGIANGTAIGIILDVPPGIYTSTTGVLIPQTSNIPATAPLIIRSTMDAQLTSMPEPVCAGGIQDNIPESANIGLINSDCQAGGGGGTFGYQLGTTVTAIPSGPFMLANGTPVSTSNYNYLQFMYQDQCTSGGCLPLQLCSPNSNPPNHCGGSIGPDHWEFEDGAAALSPGNTTDNDIINTGVTAGATNISQFASHIHFRRYWVHGDWTSLTTGANAMADGFNLSGCYYCSVVGSQVSQAMRPGQEGHAIFGNGFQYKIDNDWLEGESSAVFSGGFVAPLSIPGYVPFQDVQIGRVRNTFPYSWLGALKIPSGNPSKWKGQSIARKNCEELKEGERVLVYGLICENVDNSGGQRGIVTTLNVRNTSAGGPTPQNYQATISDVTIQNSIYRNACEGMVFDSRSHSVTGEGGGVSYPMNRIQLDNILQYAITGNGLIPGCPTAGVGMQITNGGGGQSWQGTITENSDGTATFQGNCSQDAGGCIGQVASATITNAGGTSCTPATGGTLTINGPTSGLLKAAATYTCSSGTTLSGVTITNPGAYYTSTPVVSGFSGTCVGCSVKLALNASPVTPPKGFEVMDITAGDPLGISGCTVVPAFNLQTKNYFASGYYWPTQVQALATAGSAPWAGSFNSAGLAVTYDWSGAAEGAVDNGGYCTVTNGEGGPGNLAINHMTFVTDATEPIGDGPTISNGVVFAQNHTFVNSILLSGPGKSSCAGTPCAGWWDDGLPQGEGNPTETFIYDASSMTAAWLVWPGRVYTKYYEYPNNPSFADPECAATTGNWNPTAGGSHPQVGGCNPPNSMSFPATPYCSGTTPSYSGPGTGCVGFSGAMNASAMPLALADYHGYELLGGASPSYFHNGASDGTDLGAIIPSLDAAQTTNLYVCPPNQCVSSGPFPTFGTSTNLATVTFGTEPAGLSYTVDSVAYTTPQSFNWMVGSQHSVSTSSPQPGTTGIQYAFSSWSDGGDQSHGITASAGTTTYTASFNTQYELTTQASPASDGSVAPLSGGYYVAGASIPVNAAPNSGFAFNNWTSSNGGTFDSSTAASTNFYMPAAPTTVTGNFSVLSVQVAINTVPPQLGVSVDGGPPTPSPVNVSWTSGSTHTIATTSPQGSSGTQYSFTNWSDGGALSHTVTASASTTSYTATFSTAYLLTTAANPLSGGSVTPASGGYYAANASIPVNATPNGGFGFSNWTTSNGGTFDASMAPGTNFYMPAAPTTVTANFSVLGGLTATATVLQSSENPSFTGDSVTFTASVASSSGAVTAGSVTFMDGSNTLSGPTPVDGNGQATFTTNSLTEAIHQITANYSGTANFDPSTGAVSQEVDNHTVVNGNQYCNQGGVTLASSAPATPYPSRIFVTGAGASVTNVTLTLNQINSDDIQALNLLLVGPTGKQFVPFANVGDTSTISAINVTLDDGAANSLPSGTPLTSATFRPSSFLGGPFAFAAPAPAGPYDYAATDGASTFTSEFGGSNPNGTWQLFAQTGSSGGDGNIAGGWCLNIINPPILSVAKSHSGDFTQGQTGTWTIAVSNTAAGSLTSGAVTVADTLPSGYTVSSGSGTDWTCGGTGSQMMTCTNSDAVAGGGSFAPITLIVNVPLNSPASVQNVANASGGGAVNSANSNTDTVTVDQAPAITSGSSATFVVGTSGSFSVIATGSPTPSIGEMGILPAGVAFVDNHNGTGTLSGTPSTNGVFNISFTAQNGVGSPATQPFTLTVNQAPSVTSTNSATFVVGTSSAFTVSTAGTPIPSISETGTLPGGVTFADNHNGTGTLSGTALSSGVFSISFTAQNGVGSPATQSFTLTVDQAPAITSANGTTFVAGTASSFTVTTTGFPIPSIGQTGLPTGAKFVDNHNGTATLSWTPTSSGIFGMTFTAQNGVGSPATQSFTLTVGQAPVITSTTRTTFAVGTAGSFTVTATGFPTPTFSETGALPGGVTLSATGALSGTPAVGGGGVYKVTITAANGISPNGTQNFVLTVNEAPGITSANNTSFTVGKIGSFTVTATGYPVPSISETGTLPSGVTLTDHHNGNATLGGTPTASGISTFSITASNSSGSPATQSFTLTVGQAPAITSTSKTTFTVGTAGSFMVTATGTPAPTFSETGALPSGVTLSATGALSGTPAVGSGGVYKITITAANGFTPNATQSFVLTVNESPAITSANGTTFTVGQAGSFTVTTTGYPISSLSEAGALPKGVTFVDKHNGTGLLSGTPHTAGVFQITLTAQNSVGSPATQTFTLTVN